MALPDELSAANIAILVSKSAAEAAWMKLAYGALFRIHCFCNSCGASDIKYPEMQRYKVAETMEDMKKIPIIQLYVKLISFQLDYFLFGIFVP